MTIIVALMCLTNAITLVWLAILSARSRDQSTDIESLKHNSNTFKEALALQTKWGTEIEDALDEIDDRLPPAPPRAKEACDA